VTERFAPSYLVDDKLFEGAPDSAPSLKGDIDIKDVTILDEEGQVVLEDISLSIPQGARVAVKTNSEAAALAFADMLTREVIPQRGSISIAGQALNTIHQVTLANSIGYAHSKPHIMQGTLGENILLPLKNKPIELAEDPADVISFREKAEQSGNSIDHFDSDWIDPTVAGLESSDEIREWWFELVRAMGIDDFMVRRALRSLIVYEGHQELAEAIVRLRPEIATRIAQAGLDDVVHSFHPDKFNQVSPLGSNLLYALPTRMLTQESLSKDENFLRIIKEQGIGEELLQMSITLVENLTATFGKDGTDHPLFRRLNLDEDLYHRLGAIINKRRELGDAELPSDDYALMLTVPFAFSAEQMGPAFTDSFKDRVLQIRKTRAAQMVQEMGDLFATIDPQKYIPVMTLMGNAIFGRVSRMAGAREKMIEDVVVEVLNEHGLRRLAAESIHDLATSSGGDNLPAVFKERVAFSRAGIKKPDVLILANSLASHDSDARALMRERISTLMPDTTKIFIENQINNPENYDLYVEIEDGRIDGESRNDSEEDTDGRKDLNRKMGVIAKTELFGGLDRKNQRLLAFGAQWYKAEKGRVIFAVGEEADAAYLCIKGSAGLYWTSDNNETRMISEIEPGRLIGDVSIILEEKRPLDLIALEDCVFLRIGASELIAVIENDAMVASSLMRSVAENMMGIADTLRQMRSYSTAHGVDFTEFDKNR
jgi:putative ABC transport system ATP-binding protein